MLKDLVVLLGEAGTKDPVFNFAVSLAQAHQAHLIAVVCAGVPLYQEYLLGTVIYEAYQSEVTRQTKVAESVCAEIREQLNQLNLSSEVRRLVVDMDILPMDAVVHARYADLVLVAARGEEAEARMWDRLVQSILFHAGRPLLVVPEGARPPLDHVVIGWNASREAVRAIHDGMEFIAGARHVDIVVVDPVPSDDGHGAEPGADLAAHLARHVTNVNVYRIDSEGETVGTVLQDFAMDRGANLLIMGAYGHSRMWEMLLGGATRDVLGDTRIPILASH